MAQGLRAQELALILPLALLGCGEEPAEAAPQYSDPDELVAAVLEHCHGPLQGMDHVILSLFEDGDPIAENISLWLPDRMHVQVGVAGGTAKDTYRVDTLVAGEAWRKHEGESPVRLEGDELAGLVKLRDLLSGLLLIPLYERNTVTADESGLLLEMADGERWHLELREGSLLPASLKGPSGEVVFLDYLTTSLTRLPRMVVLGDLGERRVRLLANDVSFVPQLFTVAQVSHETGDFSFGGIHRPETPEIMEIRASFWLEMEDPGDWERRHESVAKDGLALLEQGQLLTGLTGFVEEHARRLMVIPFSPDPERGRTFEPAGRTVRELPDHRALVVYTGPGPFEEVVASGSRALVDDARSKGLQADGAIRAYPLLSLGKRAPTDDDLANLVVRLELPIK